MSKKVYCKGCIYVQEPISPLAGNIHCYALGNLNVIDTYYEPKEVTISLAKDINKYNNCPWFKKE